MTAKGDVPPIRTDPDPIVQLVDAINESLSIAQIKKAIHRLPISADAKAIVVTLAKVGVQVGETLLRVGRMVVSFAIDLGRRFPNTTFGIVISAVVTALIAFIPWVGPLLWPLLGPLLAAFGIYVGMTNDMRMSALKARESLLSKMEAAEKSGLLERIEAFERRFQFAEDTVRGLPPAGSRGDNEGPSAEDGRCARADSARIRSSACCVSRRPGCRRGMCAASTASASRPSTVGRRSTAA